MNRVMDASFNNSFSSNQETQPINQNHTAHTNNGNYANNPGNHNNDSENLDIIRDIADGNITFG